MPKNKILIFRSWIGGVCLVLIFSLGVLISPIIIVTNSVYQYETQRDGNFRKTLIREDTARAPIYRVILAKLQGVAAKEEVSPEIFLRWNFYQDRSLGYQFAYPDNFVIEPVNTGFEIKPNIGEGKVVLTISQDRHFSVRVQKGAADLRRVELLQNTAKLVKDSFSFFSP